MLSVLGTQRCTHHGDEETLLKGSQIREKAIDEQLVIEGTERHLLIQFFFFCDCNKTPEAWYSGGLSVQFPSWGAAVQEARCWICRAAGLDHLTVVTAHWQEQWQKGRTPGRTGDQSGGEAHLLMFLWALLLKGHITPGQCHNRNELPAHDPMGTH